MKCYLRLSFFKKEEFLFLFKYLLFAFFFFAFYKKLIHLKSLAIVVVTLCYFGITLFWYELSKSGTAAVYKLII